MHRKISNRDNSTKSSIELIDDLDEPVTNFPKLLNKSGGSSELKSVIKRSILGKNSSSLLANGPVSGEATVGDIISHDQMQSIQSVHYLEEYDDTYDDDQIPSNEEEQQLQMYSDYDNYHETKTFPICEPQLNLYLEHD